MNLTNNNNIDSSLWTILLSNYFASLRASKRYQFFIHTDITEHQFFLHRCSADSFLRFTPGRFRFRHAPLCLANACLPPDEPFTHRQDTDLLYANQICFRCCAHRRGRRRGRRRGSAAGCCYGYGSGSCSTNAT
jgi:hypothetical protein